MAIPIDDWSVQELTSQGIPMGYELLPMIYTGPVTPGGPNHTFEGTVEQIVDQIRLQGLDATIFNDVDDLDSRVGVSSLEGREVTDVVCGGPYDEAKLTYITQGINYLKKLHGDCGLPPGPGDQKCGRISCSYDAGIL